MKLNGSAEFIQKAKEAVYLMVIEGLDPTDHVEFTIDDVYVVNSQYVLGSQKAQLSTTLPDGKYYEVTYNDAKEEMYVDGYVKFNKHLIK
jgi:hypothetical protein